jgi:hypothetical protein
MPETVGLYSAFMPEYTNSTTATPKGKTSIDPKIIEAVGFLLLVVVLASDRH